MYKRDRKFQGQINGCSYCGDRSIFIETDNWMSPLCKPCFDVLGYSSRSDNSEDVIKPYTHELSDIITYEDTL